MYLAYLVTFKSIVGSRGIESKKVARLQRKLNKIALFREKFKRYFMMIDSIIQTNTSHQLIRIGSLVIMSGNTYQSSGKVIHEHTIPVTIILLLESCVSFLVALIRSRRRIVSIIIVARYQNTNSRSL